MEETRLQVLIVDSGAIIRGHGLGFHKCVAPDGFYTVTEVLNEIRDSKARELLNQLPFELHVRQPSDASMRAVAAFAKKTGDFSTLSLTDLKLLALTHTFETELSGGDHIRTEPVRAATAQTSPKKESTRKPKVTTLTEEELASGKYTDCNCGDEDHVHQEHAEAVSAGEEKEEAELVYTEEIDEDDDDDVAEDAADDEGEESRAEEVAEAFEGEVDEAAVDAGSGEEIAVSAEECQVEEVESVESSMARLEVGAVVSEGKSSWASIASRASELPAPPARVFKNSASAVEVIPMNESSARGADFFGENVPATAVEGAYTSRILRSGGNANAQAMAKFAEEDDGEGWINAGNIKSVKAKGGGILSSSVRQRAEEVPAEDARVACVTTDYSMQNVLIQMNLRVMSIDGLLVRTVKQWVLRCSACYKIHTDMDRLFCSKCGTNHLHRIATSIDAATGVLKLHLKKNFKVSTRGKIYPLPKPGQQGKYEGEILLREDQLLSGIWRQKVVKINHDVRSAFGADIVSDLGLQLNKGSAIKVGLGRANPNADKGRSRRGGSRSKKH